MAFAQAQMPMPMQAFAAQRASSAPAGMYGYMPQGRQAPQGYYQPRPSGPIPSYQMPLRMGNAYKWGTQRGTAAKQRTGPGLDPLIPDPIVISHKVNTAANNKSGVPVWDRKHRGVSRNVLGGFYTS